VTRAHRRNITADTRKHLAVGLTAVTLAAGLTACANSGDGADKGAKTVSKGSATGTPLKILIASMDVGAEDVKRGANLAANAINDAGGIDNHPIQIVYCVHNTGDDNAAGACVSKALKDPAVVAGAAWKTTAGAVTTPMINDARLACLGCLMFGPTDFTAPAFFPDQAGFLAVNLQVQMAKDILGAHTVTMPFRLDTTAGLPDLVAATKPTGLELVNLPVNAAQSDLSATAAELISKKPDAIVDGIELPLFNKLMLAVEAQGAKIPVTVAAVSVGPKTIKDRLAGVTSPVSILSVVNRTSKGFADYEADVKKYDPNQDSNDASVSAWLAIKYLFTKNVAAALEGKEITRQAVWDTTNSLKAVNTEGLMPPMDWSTPTKLLGGTVTRGFNTTGYAYKYAGGDWKLEGNAFSLGDGQK